jgi:hypothetical protein
VPGGACTTNPGADNCINGVWACASPIAARHCADSSNKKTSGTCQGTNLCNAAGVCVQPCQPGGVCTTNPGQQNCIAGVYKCASPTATRNCADDTVKLAAGSACAGGKVCNATGVCVTRCAGGGGCTINPDQQNCINGISHCDFDWSVATCVNGALKSAGSTCASGTRICNPTGGCVNRCVSGGVCQTNPGRESCFDGVNRCDFDWSPTPQCVNGTVKPFGSSCGLGIKTCDDAGNCKVSDLQPCTASAECASSLCYFRAGSGDTVCFSCGNRDGLHFGENCCPRPGANFCKTGICSLEDPSDPDPSALGASGFCCHDATCNPP